MWAEFASTPEGAERVGMGSHRFIRWMWWTLAMAVGIGIGFAVTTTAPSVLAIGIGFIIAALVAGFIGWKSQDWWCVASPPVVVLVPLVGAIVTVSRNADFLARGWLNLLMLLGVLLLPVAALMAMVAVGITAHRIEWSLWRR